MSENLIKPLSKKLSRGFLSQLAREKQKSRTAIVDIADGRNTNHPDIYNEILQEAIRYKAELEEKAKLEEENRELARQL